MLKTTYFTVIRLSEVHCRLNPFGKISAPFWEVGPILVNYKKVIGSKDVQIDVLFPQLEETNVLTCNILNPEKGFTTKRRGKIRIKTSGMEHAIGIRRSLTKRTLETCAGILKSQESKKESIIAKLDEILTECREEKTTWKKKKEEFDFSSEIPCWPDGYLTQWLKVLARTRRIKTGEEDISHLEKNYHKWAFIPSEEKTSPGKDSEIFAIVDDPSNAFIQGREPILLCALQNRPNEVLDFLAEDIHFLQIEKKNQINPVEEFLSWWLKNIPNLKGTLVPVF